MSNHLPNNNQNDLFGNVVSSYTRQQAINDGVLIDVSTLAAALGFNYPVAITDSVNAHYERGYKGFEPCAVHRSLLTDVLHAIRQSSRSSNQLQYVAHFDRRSDTPVPVIVEIGPGDTPEPVITIMLSQDL